MAKMRALEGPGVLARKTCSTLTMSAQRSCGATHDASRTARWKALPLPVPLLGFISSARFRWHRQGSLSSCSSHCSPGAVLAAFLLPLPVLVPLGWWCLPPPAAFGGVSMAWSCDASLLLASDAPGAGDVTLESLFLARKAASGAPSSRMTVSGAASSFKTVSGAASSRRMVSGAASSRRTANGAASSCRSASGTPSWVSSTSPASVILDALLRFGAASTASTARITLK
mmetsp:Transcript_31516/g.73087  ORF Transcript_31516/g.73087 Transcript_31516/m.73087 type:complete len:229 (+) Transcript_31516:390-1076(+)|eukprot:CAMPEP_0171081546 /NCGR_PEP_ID=MMETSP0766_2-20121228/16564_1 /TAXON_ID=439317 /ORGANISM="Gambierdiscus australes, Strain CAWD 149" /LENGTH=228 /DNA_ID=CAMNT_0011538855 /DNA_START=389 /DNA_END=1075 /DNA_ORIENTATION=-